MVVGLRPTSRSLRPQADLSPVPDRRGRDGGFVCATHGSDHDALGRHRHGHVRQRHGRWIRHADVRSVSHGGARDRAERVVEPGARSRRIWPRVVGAIATTYSFQVAIALLASIYLLDMLVTL